jgi:hypothetical protein
VFAAADDAALRLAGTPHDCQAEWLQGFGQRARAQWGEVFGRYLSAEDVDAVVADLVGHVKAKRDRIERFGSGTA